MHPLRSIAVKMNMKSEQSPTFAVLAVLLALAAAAGPLSAQTGETSPGSWTPDIPQAARAAELWQTIRQADRNSDAFRQALAELDELIAGLRRDYRVPVAAAMMEWGADDVANTTAIKFFGKDGLPLDDIRELLFNPKRSWKERVLIRTYYRFVRPEYETLLGEKTRRRMMHMLAQRMVDLAGYDKVAYGEQRLLNHMLQAVLARYATDGQNVAELSEVKQAMRTYTAKKRPGDALAASIGAWLELADRPKFKIRNERDAILAMGHWDPLIANTATAYLQQQIRNDPSVGDRVFLQFNDPRDEVRAAVCRVFAQATNYKPERVTPELANLLANDRGVVVHQAAADALINRADQVPPQVIGVLLNVLKSGEPKPGPKRTESILVTLSYLVLETPRLDRATKQQLLNVALEKLELAPEGSLKLMESLGTFAKSAVPAIKEYRDTKADLYMRRMIDRHVLMAIDPKAARTGG